MAQVLKCGDLMPGCDFVANGETVDEVLQKAAEHARTAHQISDITPEIVRMVQGAIKTE